jgi:hypothetical protein
MDLLGMARGALRCKGLIFGLGRPSSITGARHRSTANAIMLEIQATIMPSKKTFALVIAAPIAAPRNGNL